MKLTRLCYKLNDRLWFPNPDPNHSLLLDPTEEEEDLLLEGKLEIPSYEELLKTLTPIDDMIAVEGDLRVERLLLAYRYGIFPWFSFRSGPIQWCAPIKRFVIFPDEIHVSHSMRTLMNKHVYRVTFNTAFDQVIKACSTVDGRINEEGAWLGDDIIEAYTKLHELGHARSVEVWRDKKLVGGLYGVAVGKGFVGESMFSHEPNTSKLALIALARQMQEQGGSLIDCQIRTPHLESLGGRYIEYKEYIDTLHGDKSVYEACKESPYLGPERPQ